MASPISLHLHTLDSLLNELVSGRAVLVGDDGEQYVIETEATRSILAWFIEDKGRWIGQVRGDDEANAIIKASKNTPPLHPTLSSSDATTTHPIYTVKSIRAYHFAGLHTYGSTDEVLFDLSDHLTLFEGKNGSGKTSLLNALIWCLTGKILRAQQLPQSGDCPVTVSAKTDVEDETEGDLIELEAKSVAVSPTPPRDKVIASIGNYVPIDTWVEVVLVDEANVERTFKRRIYSNDTRKSIKFELPDFTPLGLQPNALEIGTIMPGILPLIQIGTPNDIGQAVSELTGFSDLRDLAKRANSFSKRMKGQMTKALQADRSQIDISLSETWQELIKRLEASVKLTPSDDELINPPISSDKLQHLEAHFNALESEAFTKAKDILGEGFDPSIDEARQELGKSTGPAIGLTDIRAISSLSSTRRLSAFKSLDEEERVRAKELLHSLLNEYQEISDLAASPNIAARERLYARVADWMRETDEEPKHLETCALCYTTLEGKIDHVTGQQIKQHLRTRLDEASEALSFTLESWVRHAEAKLARDLHEGLRAEMEKDLPDAPYNLMIEALTVELFDQQPFQGSLSALKPKITDICKDAFTSLPIFEEPEPITLPDGFTGRFPDLSTKINRIHRALAFASWRDDNSQEWGRTIREVIGTAEIENDTSINGLLSTLASVIANAGPITDSLNNVKQLQVGLTNRKAKDTAIDHLAITAKNMEPLLNLGSLVDRQMKTLRKELHNLTESWKQQVYCPAFPLAPRHADTVISEKGELNFSSETNGTRTPSQHVSNASDMRATLFAFLIAFWEHMRATHGGVQLLVFDDPQELFDRDNRRNLANGLTQLATRKGQLLIASYDPAFSDTLVSSIRQAPLTCNHRRVSPTQANKPFVSLDAMESDLKLMFNAFQNPPAGEEHLKARLYVNELRIYVEARLSEFFPERLPGLSSDDTLGPYLNKLKTYAREGKGVFADSAFQKIANAPVFEDGSEARKLLNRAHHKDADTITQGEVTKLIDSLKTVKDLIDDAYVAFEQDRLTSGSYLSGRQPSLSVAPPSPMEQPNINVPVYLDLAAATGDTHETLDDKDEIPLTGDIFEGKSLYDLNCHSFGFSAERGNGVIVDTEPTNVESNRLVIARYSDKIIAGRLIRDETRPSTIVIASEDRDPTKRAMHHILPQDAVALHKVTGIMFNDTPPDLRRRAQGSDAALSSRTLSLEGVVAAFRIRDESAVPLALPGQTVLGGRALTPQELTDGEGMLVALYTSDGRKAFKRIGKFAIPDRQDVLMFEAIGGQGGSLTLAIEETEDTTFPFVVVARRIHGIIY